MFPKKNINNDRDQVQDLKVADLGVEVTKAADLSKEAPIEAIVVIAVIAAEETLEDKL
jgi:hypothetical protein